MKNAGVEVPKGEVKPKDTEAIRETAKQFWNSETFTLDDQRISLAVLTQLCESLVWWTQRYKIKEKEEKNND